MMASLFASFNAFKADLVDLYDSEEALSITELVFEEILNLPKHMLRLEAKKELSENEVIRIEEIKSRLLNGEPVQYILGFAWFLGKRFLVNPHVLIPRRETEELVMWCLDELRAQPEARILDIGTGSGCIAISIKDNLPLSEVFAIDISESALKTARSNTVELLNLNSQQSFIRKDILDCSWWNELGKFDLIVSNPPYITEKEKASMHSNVLCHEPAGALFVPDTDPFRFYLPLARFAFAQLNKGGKLLLEINETLAKPLKRELQKIGFTGIQIRQDMQGKDRMILANLPD